MDKENIDIKVFGISYILLAIAILECWMANTPWYIGVALGILISFLTALGIIPVIGQIIFYLVVKHIMVSIVGQVLTMTMYVGIFITILYSIAVGIGILLAINDT